MPEYVWSRRGDTRGREGHEHSRYAVGRLLYLPSSTRSTPFEYDLIFRFLSRFSSVELPILAAWKKANLGVQGSERNRMAYPSGSVCQNPPARNDILVRETIEGPEQTHGSSPIVNAARFPLQPILSSDIVPQAGSLRHRESQSGKCQSSRNLGGRRESFLGESSGPPSSYLMV